MSVSPHPDPNKIRGFAPAAPFARKPAMNIEQARFNMIEQQIRPWDVLDPGVLSLLAVVKREDFVPAAYRALAFVDTEVPPALLAQLKVGGRLAAIVGQLPIMRAMLFTRATEHDFGSVALFDTVAPRLSGFGEPSRFKF